MTREEAEEYAKEMTYRDAINNLMKARSIPYRKATFIKVNELLKALEQEPKTGHCEDCKHFQKLPYHAGTLGKCVNHWGFCPKGDWYCADFEPQESEDKECTKKI